MKYGDGDIYNGEFANGVRQGRGQLISSNYKLHLSTGEIIDFPNEYDGLWNKDKKDGKGTLIVNS